ncbi:MAG: 2'-5' RNA ligase family protein [Anaerolineales bacterium]|nr:2'-5' RNA ligase family protein [Anaerolineales bacterium]
MNTYSWAARGKTVETFVGELFLRLVGCTMMRETYTALCVPVQEAMFLQPFRVRHVSAPATTMPPHISLLGPFKAIETIDRNVLEALKEITDSWSRFSFVLRKTSRFPDIQVLYLEPEPATPFQALNRAVRVKFPEVVPKFLDPIMHLTLARVNDGELDQVKTEFYREYGSRLPIEATATEVGLYEKRDNAWHQRTLLALA